MRGLLIFSSNSRGFTFIEAIVSLAVIGVAILPLMALLSQSISQLNRVADAKERAAAMESALSVLDPINPLLNPSGSTMLGTTAMTWSSVALVEPNQSIQLRAGLAGYSMGFYAVTVSLSRDDQPWFSFEARKAGYRRVQITDSPFTDTTSR